MPSSRIRMLAFGILLLCVLAWIYGGARMGFYHTYFTRVEIDPITEIESQVQVKRFLPGSETLAAGFALFAALQIVGSALERRKSA